MLKGINWLAVLLAAVVYYVLGFLWFNVLFADLWRQLDPAAPVGGGFEAKTAFGFVVLFIIAAGVAWALKTTGASTLGAALKTALTVWVFFNLTVYLGMYSFGSSPLEAMLFYAAYDLIGFLVIAVILTLMRRRPAAA